MAGDPQQAKAYQIAIRQLARREYSRAELRTYLIQKSIPVSIVETVLQSLIEQNLLSDIRFAESVFRHRISGGWGPYRIEQELKQKRVENAIIRAIFAEMAVDWVGLARQVRAKRFGRALPDDIHERAKQYRFIQYRGFSVEQTQACFSDDVITEI